MSHEQTPRDTDFIREIVQDELETFVYNPALDELARLFGTEELPHAQSERLLALQGIAGANWNFRAGAERQDTDWNIELLDTPGTDQWNTIFKAGYQLGEVQSTYPKNTNPDSLVILGGANRAPLDRLRYGLQNVGSFGLVAYLGSSRPLNIKAGEPEKAKDYAPDARTEFDLGCGAFEKLLDARMVSEDRVERKGDIWAWREYEFEVDGETRTGFVLNTPFDVYDPEAEGKTRRANTYDNYKFFADRAELINNPDHSVVAVTTGFYVPGQHLPAVQTLTLPFGTSVETIGHDAAYSGVPRKPSQLLQETKSAIDAAVRLQSDLNATA